MKTRSKNVWRTLLALFIAVVYLAPIYILICVALKPPSDVSSYWKFPAQINWTNFDTAIHEGGILLALSNSTFITVCSVALIVICGAFAAYPLARRRTRLNKGIKSFILGIMMVPPLSILVSLYSTMVQIHGVNSYWGIIMVLVTFELPLSVYLYSNFISSIPRALDEAASIDGCGPVRTFFVIILPQLKPVTASVVILTGIHCWNDYQFSLYMLQKPSMKSVSLAISSFFSQTTSNLNAATAGALLAILPVILMFLFLQKYFIKGMVDSAVK